MYVFVFESVCLYFSITRKTPSYWYEFTLIQDIVLKLLLKKMKKNPPLIIAKIYKKKRTNERKKKEIKLL